MVNRTIAEINENVPTTGLFVLNLCLCFPTDLHESQPTFTDSENNTDSNLESGKKLKRLQVN